MTSWDSPEHAKAKLVGELKRFLPFLNTVVITVHSINLISKRAALLMNDVGVWQFRPKAETGLENLFLAGSHCRSDVDMASMEGATVTGLNAANALTNHHGIGSFGRSTAQSHQALGLPFAALRRLSDRAVWQIVGIYSVLLNSG